MSRHARLRAIVVTLGTWHEKPWWWEQIDDLSLRESIQYERIALDNKTHKQLGLLDIPRLCLRLIAILTHARRNKIAYIITFESDLTCYLIGLLQRFPGLGQTKHVILQFISREPDASFKSSIKEFIQRAFLKTVHKVVCSSRSEARFYQQRFGWTTEKSVFVALQTDARHLDHQPRPPINAVVAAGRSYRDYGTLVEAVAGTGIRTIIVCGRQGAGVANLPPEVEVVTELSLPELTGLISAARAVVLPLQDSRISTGQSVLLQAMALGKAVIATRTAGTEDYIDNGVDGILVPPGNAQALRTALLGLDAPAAARLGQAARRRISSEHLPQHYVANVSRALGC
jgi:glycosyltransferase involved in cell wall biosynthesis